MEPGAGVGWRWDGERGGGREASGAGDWGLMPRWEQEIWPRAYAGGMLERGPLQKAKTLKRQPQSLKRRLESSTHQPRKGVCLLCSGF